MARFGLVLMVLGGLCLLFFGLYLRPENVIVKGSLGIGNADFEPQSVDRIVGSIAGAALLVSGAILVGSSTKKLSASS